MCRIDPYYVGERQGWVCPKCGAVYAPHIPTCYNCQPGKSEVRFNWFREQSTTLQTPPQNILEGK